MTANSIPAGSFAREASREPMAISFQHYPTAPPRSKGGSPARGDSTRESVVGPAMMLMDRPSRVAGILR